MVTITRILDILSYLSLENSFQSITGFDISNFDIYSAPYVIERLVSTLNCKAFESTHSIRKHLIVQTQTRKPILDTPCIKLAL